MYTVSKPESSVERQQASPTAKKAAVTIQQALLDLPLFELLRAYRNAPLFEFPLHDAHFLLEYCKQHAVPLYNGIDSTRSEDLLKAIKAEYYYQLALAMDKYQIDKRWRAQQCEYLIKSAKLGGPQATAVLLRERGGV